MSLTLPLLRLDAAHGYFADGRSRGLKFEPADDTAVRLRRADVLSRQDGASLWLLGPVDAYERLVDDDPTPLSWLVRATEAYFTIYTADSARRPGELLLLQVPDISAAHHEAGSAIADEPLSAQTRVVPVAQPGNTQHDVALHLAGEASWRPPFALLRLPTTLLKPDEASQGSARPGTALLRHLRWTLPPRAIVWKYCLFGEWPEDALDVHDPDGTIGFHPPTAERLDDGRPLLALRSRAPIALAERSQARLQLRCRQAGLHRVLVKRLPVPGPQHLAREEIDGAATLVSEIHVYR